LIKVPLTDPQPDVTRFIEVVRGERIPERPPLIELFIDYPIMREICRRHLGQDLVPPDGTRESEEAYLKSWVDLHYRLGYDCVVVSDTMQFPTTFRTAQDTAALPGSGIRGWIEEGTGPISSWEDFGKYPWPDADKEDLWRFEYIDSILPEGMGMLLLPGNGFLEIVLHVLLGYENFCYLLYDEPELISAVFQKSGELYYSLYEKLIHLPSVCGFFHGDDMGFKTGTLISAEDLRKDVLPWHQRLAKLAHDNGLVYLLHSCGHIDEIMRDLIDDVKIDGRHSFEDETNSVLDFKHGYGDRIAVLGGIDIDKMCRLPEDELRIHVRQVIDACMPNGRYLLGTGNSVCNYIPVGNYLAMVEEGLNYRA
jgi:uroporphyrinogen decarboxylase